MRNPAPIALAILALAGCWQGEPELQSRTMVELRQALHLAAGHLTAQCGDSGQFVYRTHLDPELQPLPRYNVLRHAGAMYALAEYQARHPDPAQLAALLRAATFFREQCVAPVEGYPDLLMVWSRPELTGQSGPLTAKLGGAGLGLVGLISVERVAPGTTPLEELRGLGRFILAMQRSDGSFHSKFTPEEGGVDQEFVSLYYPGEAALGLIMLYELDADPRWLQSAAGALDYLARSRRGESRVPADHWALLATARLWPIRDQAPSSLSGDALIAHTRQVCESILAEQVRNSPFAEFNGGFASDGRTTPTATRVEGLLAALEYLPDSESGLRARIVVAVNDAIPFLLRAQITSGPHAGAIPRAVQVEGRTPDPRAGEVRIDYVQHVLSAMMQYLDAQAPAGAK